MAGSPFMAFYSQIGGSGLHIMAGIGLYLVGLMMDWEAIFVRKEGDME